VRADICRFALPKVNPKDWGEYAAAEPPPTYEEVKQKALRDFFESIQWKILRPNPNAGLVDYDPGGDGADAAHIPEHEPASSGSDVGEQAETATASECSETEPSPKALSEQEGSDRVPRPRSTMKNAHPPCTPNQGYHIINPDQYDDKSRGQRFPRWKKRPSPGAV
jgi:hypothetical protein